MKYVTSYNLIFGYLMKIVKFCGKSDLKMNHWFGSQEQYGKYVLQVLL
jgi:hypothetical protein